MLLGATALDELGSFYIRNYLHASNLAWYNGFMGIEFWIFAYYYSFVLTAKWQKNFLKIYLWLFPVLWFVVVFLVFGLTKWNSYIAVAGSFFTVFFSVCYYYQLITDKEMVVLKTCPEFWIATGLIVFYSCNMPYIGMLNYLYKNFQDLSLKLISMLDILNILMYSLFIYAFLCRINTRKLR